MHVMLLCVDLSVQDFSRRNGASSDLFVLRPCDPGFDPYRPEKVLTTTTVDYIPEPYSNSIGPPGNVVSMTG